MSDNKTPDELREQLRNRASFKHWKRELVRFSDLDQNRHVNNITFLVFAQSGRVAVLRESGAPDGANDETWMVVNVNMDFIGQLHYPGDVDIGSAVTRIGNSSVTISQGIFDGERCAAVVTNTVVRVDQASGKPTRISDDLRQALLDIAPLQELP